MNFRQHNSEDLQAIVRLVASVFTESEGPSEGALVGKVAQDLFGTDERDVFNFVADENSQIVGSIFFSRLTFEDVRDAFILGPVAVRSDRQGSGIGQALINYGLESLQNRSVSMVLTYGDPAFYQKVGFQKLSEDIIKAPFDLSRPEGWLGQSFVSDAIEPSNGRCSCVEALNDPVYW